MYFPILKEQLESIVRAVLLGAFFAFVYDGIRIIRLLLAGDKSVTKLKHTKVLDKIPSISKTFRIKSEKGRILLANLFDLLYSIYVTSVYCIFSYAYSYGIFRLYVLFSTVCGFVLYRVSVSKVLLVILSYVAYALRRISGFVLFIILKPLFLLIKGSIRLLKPIIIRLHRRINVFRTEHIRKQLYKRINFTEVESSGESKNKLTG